MVNMEKLEENLTLIYKEMYSKMISLGISLNQNVFEHEYDLMFSSLMQYETEEIKELFYPVLVIKIKYLCDVELWFDKIIITARTDITNLLEFDISKFERFNYDLYGCKEYPYMFYNKNMSIDLNDKLNELKELGEKEIGIQVYLDKDIEKEEFGKVIKHLYNMKIFYYNRRKR